MRKIFLIFTLILSLKITAHAQGTVFFNNSATSLISTNLFGNSGPARIGSFLVALYGGSATATEGQLVQLGAPTIITNTAGRFFGGTRTNPFTSTEFVVGTFQIRVWSSAYADYESAIATGNLGFVGKSALWTQDTTPVNSIDTPIPITGNSVANPGYGTFSGVVITVPEPSTMALGLAGLGVVGLLRPRQIRPTTR